MTTMTAAPTGAASKLTDQGRKAQTELQDLKLGATSAVDAGDNPMADMLLLKQRADAARAAGAESGTGSESFWEKAKKWAGAVKKAVSGPRTISEIRAAREFQEDFYELRWDLYDSVNSILECADPKEMAAKLSQTVEEFADEAKKLVAEAGDTAKSAEFADLMTALTEGAAASESAEKRAPFVAHLKRLEAFEFPAVAVNRSTNSAHATPAEGEEQEKAMSIKNTQPTAAGPATLDDVLKRMSSLEDSNKASAETIKALQDQNKALQDRVQAAESDKATAEFTAKASAIGVPGFPVGKVAGVLKSAFAVSKENGETLETILKALTEQAKVGRLFSEAPGSSGDGADGGEGGELSAEEELAALAADFQKKDPKLSDANAYLKAARARPDLAEASETGR